jgi:uncharacterized membrane protein YeaQ/YmgE (transglycosylase-associated protein family)
MSLLGWIFFGLITGFIASKVVNRQGEGCFLNIALGLVGAMVGGFIFSDHRRIEHHRLQSLFDLRGDHRRNRGAVPLPRRDGQTDAAIVPV